MLKLSIQCTRFETNYSSCSTGRSSENICGSNEGAQEKTKNRMKLSFSTKIGGKFSLGPSYFILNNFHS